MKNSWKFILILSAVFVLAGFFGGPIIKLIIMKSFVDLYWLPTALYYVASFILMALIGFFAWLVFEDYRTNLSNALKGFSSKEKLINICVLVFFVFSSIVGLTTSFSNTFLFNLKENKGGISFANTHSISVSKLARLSMEASRIRGSWKILSKLEGREFILTGKVKKIGIKSQSGSASQNALELMDEMEGVDWVTGNTHSDILNGGKILFETGNNCSVVLYFDRNPQNTSRIKSSFELQSRLAPGATVIVRASSDSLRGGNFILLRGELKSVSTKNEYNNDIKMTVGASTNESGTIIDNKSSYKVGEKLICGITQSAPSPDTSIAFSVSRVSEPKARVYYANINNYAMNSSFKFPIDVKYLIDNFGPGKYRISFWIFFKEFFKEINIE